MTQYLEFEMSVLRSWKYGIIWKLIRRKKLKKKIIFCSFAFLFAFGLHASGSRVSAQEPVVGGYGDTSIRDRDVRKAANFAVKQRSANVRGNFTLISIRKAEVQVVAGLNYRICMRVRDGRGRISTVTTVVYKNLKKRMSLTRWKAGGCSEL